MSRNTFPEFVRDPNKLSADEFCQKLCQWFQEQGLMSELRAHLRALMVTALKGTALGPQRLQNNISPKVHSINLLVAEFLLQQQYHYTLSVFSTEAPIQEFTSASVGSMRLATNTNSSQPRFLQRDVRDILESLGLPPDTEECFQINSLYQENEDRDSLLTCIFRILPHYRPREIYQDKSHVVMEQPVRDEGNDQNFHVMKPSKQDLEWTNEMFNTEIPKILTQCNMKMEHARQLQDQLKKFLELEVSRVHKEEEFKYQQELLARETNIQSSLKQRDGLFRHLIDESQTRIQHEKNDVIKKRQEMNEIATQMRQSHDQMSRRFTALEEWGDTLRRKELESEKLKHQDALQLAEKKSQLDLQQRQLDMEFKRLHEEQEVMEDLKSQAVKLKQSLQQATQVQSQESQIVADLRHENTRLRHTLESTRRLLEKQSTESIHKELKQQNKSRDDVLSHQATGETEKCRQLHTENSELHARTEQQERRIEELTSRAARLVIELEDANIAITLLSRTDLVQGVSSNMRAIAVAPQPPPLPLLPPRESREAGAGEISYITPTQAETTPQRLQTSSRRKPPKRLVVYNQSSSDEASPTDDMLQEARRRLRTLEEESDAVDRRFWEFRQKQADILGSTMSTMFQPVSKPSSLGSSHHKRKQAPPSTSFHSEYETSLPSYTRLNSRPSLYQQVVEASTRSRTSRMTDLFQSSSSDGTSPYTFPHQLRNVNEQSVSQYRFLENISSNRHPTQATNTPPKFSTSPMQYSHASQKLASNTFLPANSYTVLNGMQATSIYNTSQVSYDENPSNMDRQNITNIQKIITDKPSEQADTSKHVESEDSCKKVKDKPSRVHFAPEDCSLLFSSKALIPEISPTPSDLSCPSIESATKVSSSLPALSSAPNILLEIARQNEASINLIEPLQKPDCQLETSLAEDCLSNEPVGEANNNQDDIKIESNTKTLEVRNNLHNSTAMPGHLSGSGSLPLIENLSVSSIDVSSDQPISVGGDDGKQGGSDDDFYT